MRLGLLLSGLKYAAIGAAILILFSLFKSFFIVNHLNLDTYVSLVAFIFMLAGGVVVYYYVPLNAKPQEKQHFTNLLSRQERKVYELLLSDKSNKEIADELCIELSTLKSHINRIYKKLNIKSRKELLYVPKG